MRRTVFAIFAALAAFLPRAAGAADNGALRPALLPDDPATTAPTSNLAPDPTTTAAVAKPAPTAEEDPYEALGIRMGGFILYPSLTTSAGYTTNADAAPGGSDSAFGLLEPEFILQSDWDRHSATITGQGAWQKYFDGSTPDQPSASLDAAGTVDISEGWSADVDASYAYDRQSPTDADFPVGAKTPPGVHEFTGSTSVTGAFGPGTFTLEGTADRTFYEDATTAAGTIIDQGDRTNTEFGGRLRVGIDLSPSLTPFVEGTVSRRAYDQTIDDSGIARSSTGFGGKVGIAFDTGPLLSGEASVGYAADDYDDARLSTLSALTFAGNLTWAPTELTTVTFDGSTTLNPSTDPASSGSVSYDATVNVDYAWRRNVVLNANASYDDTRYEGTGEVDTTWDAGLGLTWKMNRWAWLTGSYVHEWGDSNIPSSAYQSDTVKAGLRLQQ